MINIDFMQMPSKYKTFGVMAVLAATYTVAISVSPMSRYFGQLLNELLAMLFWIVVCAAICMRSTIDLQHARIAAPLIFGLGAMGVVIWVQYMLGHSTPYGGQVLQTLIVLTVSGLTGLCAVVLVNRMRQFDHKEQHRAARAVAWLVVGIALIQALLAWMQFLELHLSFRFIAVLDVGGRAYGNIRQFNLFALLMLIGLVACGYLVHDTNVAHSAIDSQAPVKLWIPNMMVCMAGVLITAALVMSASRFGMMALIVVAVVGLLDMQKNRYRGYFMLSIPLLYACFFFFFTWLDTVDALPFYGTQRALSIEALNVDNNQDRLAIWAAALKIIAANPWWGIGYATGASRFATDTLGLTMQLHVENAHNMFLQLALDFGVLVAVVLIGAVMFLVLRMHALLRQSDTRLWVVMLLLPLLHQMVEYPLNYTYILLPWCFLAGALLTVANIEHQHEIRCSPSTQETSAKTSYTGGFLLCIALFAATAYGYFDAKKPALLFDRLNKATAFEKITEAYETIAFTQAADYAVIQMVPAEREHARRLEIVSAKLAGHVIDVVVGQAFMQAAALNGNLCVAKSLAYRMNLSDEKTRKQLYAILQKRTEPEFAAIQNYLLSPYYIAWDARKKGDC
jgi:O-Antigen ligase/Virulence factor membrane-bound polymerase, C-terminal/Protein glycosylation ligase